MDRMDLDRYIHEFYGVKAEYPWLRYPTYAVYRHQNNKKWFAVIMELPSVKLSLPDRGTVNVVNLKCDPLLIGSLLRENGIYKGYHMNKNHWITVCLDGGVDDSKIKFLLDLSFTLTSKRKNVTNNR